MLHFRIKFIFILNPPPVYRLPPPSPVKPPVYYPHQFTNPPPPAFTPPPAIYPPPVHQSSIYPPPVYPNLFTQTLQLLSTPSFSPQLLFPPRQLLFHPPSFSKPPPPPQLPPSFYPPQLRPAPPIYPTPLAEGEEGSLRGRGDGVETCHVVKDMA